jgi:transposase
VRVAPKITLSDEDRHVLERWAKGRATPARLVLRSKIVLAAAAGRQNKGIAEELGTNRPLVSKWRTRFAQGGLAGIEKDAPRGGRPPTARDAMAARIVEWTTQRKPDNATHWSTRTLAAKLSTSRNMVARVWKANGLKPHRTRSFKLSNDPQFVQKLVDVVGLYLNPPEHALVLCCDEKSQIQALDRTQPGLPLKKGRAGTMTHDYKRNGTTTLFAAMNVLDGTVIGRNMQRHRHQEFIRFLNAIEREVPAGKLVHAILDNYAPHKHPAVQTWLARHPRWVFHFTPTSASWLNAVEGFFAILTKRRLKRGVFRSVYDLQSAINRFLEEHNGQSKPFVWTADPDEIIAAVRRGHQVLDSIH